MMMLAALYTVFLLYGSILFVTGSSTLSKEVRQSLNPKEIELFEAEMVQRRMVGLLLLYVPVFSFIWWLIIN